MEILTYIAYGSILLGSVAGVFLAISNGLSDTQTKNEIISSQIATNKELEIKLDSSEKKIDNLQSVLLERQLKIDELNAELISKSDYIQKYISGGDSYPLIKLNELGNMDNKQSKLKLNLVNEFNLPIYNTHVEVYNFDLMKSKWFNIFPVEDHYYMKPSDYDSCRITLFKNDLLYPNSNVDGIFSIPINEYNLFIKIHSRSKMIIEKITVYHHKTTFYYAIEVYDIVTNKLIRADYNKNAPQEVQKILKQRLKSIPTNLNLSLIEKE